MPECKQIVALLSEYLDQDLPQTTCQGIDRHLTQCPNCREAADSLRRTVELCRRYRAQDQPGQLAPSKQQELRTAFEKTLLEMRTRS